MSVLYHLCGQGSFTFWYLRLLGSGQRKLVVMIKRNRIIFGVQLKQCRITACYQRSPVRWFHVFSLMTTIYFLPSHCGGHMFCQLYLHVLIKFILTASYLMYYIPTVV